MQMMQPWIQFMGTVAIKEPVFEFARHNAKHNPGRTFLYTFDYPGKRTRYNLLYICIIYETLTVTKSGLRSLGWIINFRYGFDGMTSKYPFDSGVGHTDDLIYLLPTPSELNTLNEPDTQIMEKMVDLWTSFATFGVPIIATNPKFRWIPMLSRIIFIFSISIHTKSISNAINYRTIFHRQLWSISAYR